MWRPRVRHLLNPLRARRRRKEALRGIRSDVPLPFDMFDEVRSAAEAKKLRKLEGIYHLGHRRGWDGKQLLADLIASHGPIQVSEAHREPLSALLAVILWGELAAWKVSADLALHIEPLEAKMAATSQAHDEARHFYVMLDYLEHLGDIPRSVGPATTRILTNTLTAPSLPHRLLGMQMMIEPLALTIFQILRESAVEPVLAELLKNYERDEARHVALGVLHLPRLIRGMTLPEATRLWSWQVFEVWHQVSILGELKPHFDALGVDPGRLTDLAEKKQLIAMHMMMDELGYRLPIHDVVIRAINMRLEWTYPADGETDPRIRARRAWRALWQPVDTSDTTLSDVAA